MLFATPQKGGGVLPCPIYFDKRPVKIVFLVDKKKLDVKTFSKIIGYTSDQYNGKFNPIVLTDGKVISNESWEFLDAYDPDVIKSLVQIEKPLLRKIEDWLSPYILEIYDPKGHIGSHDEYTKISRPTQNLIERLSPYPGLSNRTFAAFNLKNTKKSVLKKFVELNFGGYEPWQDDHLEQMIEKVTSKEVFNLSSAKSLNDALKIIFDRRGNYVFPSQLCSIPNHSKEVGWDSDGENFTVVVGDSPVDLVYFWNRSLQVRHWLRTELTQVWLPLEIAESKDLREGLQLLLQQRTARMGNSNNGKSIRFVSSSISEAKLEKIANTLGSKVWHGKKILKIKEGDVYPDYDRNDYFHIKQGLDMYQAYSNEENVVISEPDLPEGVLGGHWMLDVYAQYRPENYQYTNARYWWRLPNRNHLARYMFPENVARIGKNGIPSVVMSTKHDFNRDANNLTIKIPSDSSIIRAFVVSDNRPMYTRDPRNSIIDEKGAYFYYVQSSDKGRYLRGLLGLFGGLAHAYHQFREPYWQNIFQILSLSNPTSNEDRVRTISNKLKKKLVNTPKNQEERNEEIEWLSEYILQRSKEHGRLGKEETFQVFLKEKLKEVEDSLRKQGRDTGIGKKRVEELRERVEDEVHELVESNILLMGVKPHCPFCGYSNWFHVDEMRQKSECRGCGKTFELRPEEKWFYRLNSLVQDSVNQHGLVPVLLTLGQIHDEARSSFIYDTSLDLFRRTKNKYKHLGDLDIVCISEGKFIMGEVKQSSSLFKKKHFDEMLALAKKIKPDVLMFASFDGKERRLITENIRRLQKDLDPFRIKVVWYKYQQIHIQY